MGVNQSVLAPDASAIVTNCHAHPSANVMLLSVQILSGRKYESVISKTKITSEYFGQTGRMLSLDCSYKHVVFLYLAHLIFHIYLHV